MITKAQASTFAATYVSGFMTRLQAALEANAIAGTVGVIGFPYPSVATQAQINNFTAACQSAGWTVSVDQVNFTVTLS